jgi:replicative DNA helicase
MTTTRAALSAPHADERQVPQDVEAERAVLGSLLLDTSAIAEIAPLLRPEDFYRGQHAAIYRAMLALHAAHEPTDNVLVSNQVEREGGIKGLDAPALNAYLAGLVMGTPSAVNAVYYAGKVQQAAALRGLLSAASRIASAVYESSGDAEKAWDAAQAAVFAVARRDAAAFRALTAYLDGYFERLDIASRGEVGEGLPTGIRDFDRLTGGLHTGDLIVLASRPGMGKTAMALQMAVAAARRGHAVAMASLEMSGHQLAHRLVSGESGIDGQRLRTAHLESDQWERVVRAIGDLSALPIAIDDTPALSVVDVRARLRTCALDFQRKGQRLGLVVVDYLQLMHAAMKRSENRVQEVSEISRQLKAMAKELNVPLVACAQLSRQADQRPGGRPQLSDLRESGQIEADADLVLFLFREEVYDPDSKRKGLADLIVAKNRQGPLADIELRFDGPTTTFQDLIQHYAAKDLER